ncbi:TPA: hypothetical protein JS275_004145 [Escherichia coli]|nr:MULTISPECIES: hypothetical protein [Enterobacteriaceae]DAY63468.1 MAG TPA: hypothetical protein [Caudoviricetes sp.]EEU2124863.1 hypothetical protein [Escherichia coli]EEV5872159.1 hypothetical protein [Escherichia coli]EEW0912223.1 hypothetical protein [Escherichia coli]EEZ4422523.1 hypothetical protein [Escherichia coli]
MKPGKQAVVKQLGKSKTARKFVQQMLKEETIRTDYLDALNFAVRFNTRRCRNNGQILTENLLKAVEKASKDYVLVAQAKNMSPREIKSKIVASSRKSRNYTIWTSDVDLEGKHSLMAGVKGRVKA